MLNPIFVAIFKAHGIATASDKGIVPESTTEQGQGREPGVKSLPGGPSSQLTRAEHIACAADSAKGRS